MLLTVTFRVENTLFRVLLTHLGPDVTVEEGIRSLDASVWDFAHPVL
jgi:hypothetical protein